MPSLASLAYERPFAGFAPAHRQVQQGVSQRQGDRALEAVFRLRSARGWILSACCVVPGSVASVDVAPFVRTAARTSTWTVRPCYRRLSRKPAEDLWRGLPGLRARHRGGHPHPAPRVEDARDAPLTGAGRSIRYSYSVAESTGQEEILLLSFLRIR